MKKHVFLMMIAAAALNNSTVKQLNKMKKLATFAV
jgi:hypothetical protein